MMRESKSNGQSPSQREWRVTIIIVNNSAHQTSPRPPHRVQPRSTAGGRVLRSTKPAPLLVLARCRSHNHITKKTKPSAARFAHGQTKVPNSFQDLTPSEPTRTPKNVFAMKIPGQLGKQKVNPLSPEAFKAKQGPQVTIAPDRSSEPARWVRIAPGNSSRPGTKTGATGTCGESSGAIGTKNAICIQAAVNPVNKRVNPPGADLAWE